MKKLTKSIMNNTTKTTVQKLIILSLISVLSFGTLFLQAFLIYKVWNMVALHSDLFSIKYGTSVIVCVISNIIINTIRKKIKNNRENS